MATYNGYNPGHPWYYYLGGKRLSIKEIRDGNRADGFKSYMAREFDLIEKRSEPHRSNKIRVLRNEYRSRLTERIARYRELARELSKRRDTGLDANPEGSCADVHTNISLVHNHIANYLAHIDYLEEMLRYQPDLFLNLLEE